MATDTRPEHNAEGGREQVELDRECGQPNDLSDAETLELRPRDISTVQAITPTPQNKHANDF